MDFNRFSLIINILVIIVRSIDSTLNVTKTNNCVIIYLLKGKLPWCGLKVKPEDKRTKAEIVYDMKKITPIHQLCSGLPAIFERMLTYAYKIGFDEKPDYIYLKRLCKKELGGVTI